MLIICRRLVEIPPPGRPPHPFPDRHPRSHPYSTRACSAESITEAAISDGR
ncbi:hypothetical protein N9M16_04115 [Candidatus Dependentiae bacterium]|nr:hypothetical protein [Candidatus Dependentiae bacterium]